MTNCKQEVKICLLFECRAQINRKVCLMVTASLDDNEELIRMILTWQSIFWIGQDVSRNRIGHSPYHYQLRGKVFEPIKDFRNFCCSNFERIFYNYRRVRWWSNHNMNPTFISEIPVTTTPIGKFSMFIKCKMLLQDFFTIKYCSRNNRELLLALKHCRAVLEIRWIDLISTILIYVSRYIENYYTRMPCSRI